jgi:hypothetical protein
MRENRPYGSEGGESGSTGLPYPYQDLAGGGSYRIWLLTVAMTIDELKQFSQEKLEYPVSHPYTALVH